MEENELQHLEFFKAKAKKLKACHSGFSEDKLIATRMMFEITKTIEMNLEERMASDAIVAASWPVLMMVYSAEDKKIIASEISCALVQNKSTTSRIVDNLIEKDFLNRTPDAIDRRKIYLHMTTKGKKYVEDFFPIYAQFQQNLFKDVDLEILKKELFKIWMNMNKLKLTKENCK